MPEKISHFDPTKALKTETFQGLVDKYAPDTIPEVVRRDRYRDLIRQLKNILIMIHHDILSLNNDKKNTKEILFTESELCQFSHAYLEVLNDIWDRLGLVKDISFLRGSIGFGAMSEDEHNKSSRKGGEEAQKNGKAYKLRGSKAKRAALRSQEVQKEIYKDQDFHKIIGAKGGSAGRGQVKNHHKYPAQKEKQPK